MKVDTLQIK